MANRLLRILFLIVLVLGSAIESRATHITGADITYRYISGNTYEFRLQVFADCDVAATPPTFYTIAYSANSCGVTGEFQVLQRSETDISPICATQTSSCRGGTAIGINKYVYTGQVTLPQNCIDWKFQWYECYRFSNISNLASGNHCLYLEAQLNNTLGNNSSPRFSNDANGFVCIDQLSEYNPGAVETDGDALNFFASVPQDTSGNIPYRAGLSLTNPMPSTTGFSVTGPTYN
jgi:hypothetical protein